MFLLCFMHYSRKLVFFLFFVAITQDWFWNEKIMIFFVNRSSLLSFGLLFLLDTFELCGILILFCYFVFSQFYSAHTLKQRCVLAVTFLLCFLCNFVCVLLMGWVIFVCIHQCSDIFIHTQIFSSIPVLLHATLHLHLLTLFSQGRWTKKKKEKRERNWEATKRI